MRRNEYAFWELYERGNSNILRAKSHMEDTLTVQSSIDFLNDHLEIFKEGDFRIKLRKTPKDSKGIITLDFTLGTPSQQAVSQIAGISETEVNQKIAEALDRAEKERKIAQMEDELNHYRQNGSGEAIAKFLHAITPMAQPIIGEIIKSFTGKTVPAVSSTEQPAAETASDKHDEIAQSLKVLFDLDPNMGNHLIQLAKKAQADPEKVKGIFPLIEQL